MQDFLDHHDEACASVGVGPMTWDDKVHSSGTYGENLNWGYRHGYTDANAAVRLWINEELLQPGPAVEVPACTTLRSYARMVEPSLFPAIALVETSLEPRY